MATINVKKNIGAFLRRGNITPELNQAIQATQFITIADYKDEMPVDEGGARQAVEITNAQGDTYTVASTAESDGGAPYPVYLHEGTGALKGAPDFGYTTGRVRAGEVTFGAGGIRPNKFAERAEKTAEPKINRFVSKFLANKLKN